MSSKSQIVIFVLNLLKNTTLYFQNNISLLTQTSQFKLDLRDCTFNILYNRAELRIV